MFRNYAPKIKVLLPWFSFLWGIISGVLIARDYAHTWKVLAFFLSLLIVFVVFSIFSIWYNRVLHKDMELGKVQKKLLIHANKISWTIETVAQIFVQYILLFSLSFLFFSQAWLLLLITIIAVASSLWDPWWQRLIKFELYRVFIRILTTIITLSFIVSVIIPSLLPWIQIIIGYLIFFIAIPWGKVFAFSLEKTGVIIVPLLFCGVLLVLIHSGINVFPIISIWVKHGEIGFDVEDRKIVYPLKKSIKHEYLMQELQNEKKLCCQTPIVAPYNVQTNVVHKWYIDDNLIDSIELGELHGLSDKAAFRTYSCKKNIYIYKNARNISCVVFLDNNAQIGKVSLDIDL